MEWMNTDVDVSRSVLVRKVGDVVVARMGRDPEHHGWRQVSLRTVIADVEVSLVSHGIWPDADVEADRRAIALANKMQRIAALMEEP